MSVVVGLLVLVWLPLFPIGLALWLLPIARLTSYRALGRIFAIAGAGAFLLSVVLVAASDPTSFHAPAPSETPTLVSSAVVSDTSVLRPTVRDESVYPPVLNRELDFGAARGPEVIEATDVELERLGHALVDGKAKVDPAIKTINVIVFAGTSDRANRKLIHFSVETEALSRLARKGVRAPRFLDVVHDAGSWTPINDDVVTAYCTVRSPFCNQLQG